MILGFRRMLWPPALDEAVNKRYPSTGDPCVFSTQSDAVNKMGPKFESGVGAPGMDSNHELEMIWKYRKLLILKTR